MTRNGTAFPSLGQAVLLTVAVVGLMVLVSIPLTLLSVATGVSIVQHPGGIALMNAIAFGLVLSWSVRRSAVPAATVFYFRPSPGLLIAPLAIAALGLGILLSEVDNVFRYFFPIPNWAAEMFKDLFQAKVSWWGSFLALVVVAPITEELLYRGVIFRGLLSRYSFGPAAVISASLFALVHLNPWQFLTALALGVVFAWYVYKTGSIVPALIGHALHNGLTLFIGDLPFEIQGFNPEELPTQAEFQPIWLDLTGALLAAVGIYLFKILADRANAQRPAVPPLLHPGA